MDYNFTPNIVYHQYSVTTILLAVTPISFEKFILYHTGKNAFFFNFNEVNFICHCSLLHSSSQ